MAKTAPRSRWGALSCALRCGAAAFIAGCAGPNEGASEPKAASSDSPHDTGLGAAPGDRPADPYTPPDDTDLPDDEPGETPDTARVLPPVGAGFMVSDRIDPPGDTDWYQLDLSAGESVWMGVLANLRDPASPLAPLLTLRWDDGRTSVHRRMPANIGDDDTSVVLSTDRDTTVWIGIQAATPGGARLDADPTIGSPDHRYSLQIEPTRVTEGEPDNNTPAGTRAWMDIDGNWAYVGDPYLHGHITFAARGDTANDIDHWPWTVDGRTETGGPASVELWGMGPWPGCNAPGTWRVTSESGDLLAEHTAPTVDPLWQLTRAGLPLLPDIGVLVAAPPGTFWLTVEHGSEPDGTVCAGILAGWYADAFVIEADLPEPSGRREVIPLDRGDSTTVAAIIGQLDSDETLDQWRIPVDAEKPWLHILVQAARVGSPLDASVAIDGEWFSESTLDANPDPEVFDRLMLDQDYVDVDISSDGIQGGMYILQVHATAEPLR